MASLELPANRTFVIAEAGTNHWGETDTIRMMMARHYIGAAASCGADAVKFQFFTKGEPLFCPVEGDDKRWEYWEKTILSREQWLELTDYAKEEGIILLASAFQYATVAWVDWLELPAHKVASRAARNYPYSDYNGPFIVSNGMGLPDVLPKASWVLHCISRYPVALNELELDEAAMVDGYSSHCRSEWAGIAAIARNVKILEVHFRDQHMLFKSRDFPVELDRDQLSRVIGARDAFAAIRQNQR